VIAVVLGLFSSSLLVYAAFTPNTVLTAELLNKIRPLGVDQDWVNMLDANNPSGETRTKGGQYLNNTGRPIVVSITISSPDYGELQVSPKTNGPFVGINATYEKDEMTSIIPPGYWYRYINQNGALAKWFELREIPTP